MSDPLTMLAELAAEVASLRERVTELEGFQVPTKRWLTAAEAGDYLGISDRAVYERVRLRRIPAEAVRHSGRRVYIDRQELDAGLAGEK